MNKAKENFVAWLRDAHAMETQAETMFMTTAEQLDSYLEIKSKLEAYGVETREQARLIAECLKRYEVKPSVIKDIAAKVMGAAQGLSGAFVSDEVVKAAIACYTFTHMEIASYRSLIAAAEMIADTETQRVCERILPQELAKAQWLEEQLPLITRWFLSLRINT